MSPDAPRPSRRNGFRLSRFVRAALGMSAVALTVLGVTQISDTSAAWQDTGNTATSGRLVVSPDVLPAISEPTYRTQGPYGFYFCRLSWTHLGPAYSYKVYVKLDDGSWTFSWMNKAENIAEGEQVTDDIDWDDANYDIDKGSRNLTVEIHTVNRYTGEEGPAWRGAVVYRYRFQFSLGCVSGASSATTALEANALNARGTAAPEITATSTTSPTPPTTTTAAAPSTSSTTTTPTTPSSTSTSSTTSAAPSSTTSTRPAPTTTTTAAPTTTTTVEADTALGVEKQSPSASYSAALVMPSGTSQPAIAIFDADGEAVARIRSTSAARYEWDSSTDTLWIVDGGRLYKATGGDWAETAVDPSSSEVPEHIAALLG